MFCLSMVRVKYGLSRTGQYSPLEQGWHGRGAACAGCNFDPGESTEMVVDRGFNLNTLVG